MTLVWPTSFGVSQGHVRWQASGTFGLQTLEKKKAIAITYYILLNNNKTITITITDLTENTLSTSPSPHYSDNV